MEFDRLVDEIAKRVAARINGQGTDAIRPLETTAKLNLLVLAHGHHQRSHFILKREELSVYYEDDCAIQNGKTYDLADYGAVILLDLSIEAMVKIASAIADTSYTEIASRAILTGKKVYVPNEEIELLLYKDTAPASYYATLLEKLKLLAEAGVVFCPAAELESRVLAEAKNGRGTIEAHADTHAAISQKETALNKKLITEKDVIEAGMEGAARLLVGRRAIVTDLARDYAKERGLRIVRS